MFSIINNRILGILHFNIILHNEASNCGADLTDVPPGTKSLALAIQIGNISVIFFLMLSSNCEIKIQIVAIQYERNPIITGPPVLESRTYFPWIMKINKFRGDLTEDSAKKEHYRHGAEQCTQSLNDLVCR